MTRTLLASGLLLSLSCFGQSGATLFRESFGFGATNARPKSGKGKLTPIFAGTGISGFWAENPADKNTTWMSLEGSGVPGWNFAATSINPDEAPTPMQPDGQNGTCWNFNDLGAFRNVALLVPINSPRVAFSISADLMPRPILGHSTSMGLTNSNVLEDNFEGGSPAWVRLLAQETGVQGSGLAEFHTRGVAGQSVSLQVPITFNGFNRVQIVVDPVALRATATVNGIVLGTLPIPAGTTKYMGFEGSGGTDNFIVQLMQ